MLIWRITHTLNELLFKECPYTEVADSKESWIYDTFGSYLLATTISAMISSLQK